MGYLHQILPKTPAAMARVIPLSLWPEEVRLHQRRRHNALSAALARLEDLRDELIAKLDELDGDPDFEPTMGAAEYQSQHHGVPSSFFLHMYPWTRGSAGSDELEPDADLESSLAEAFPRLSPKERSQLHWDRPAIIKPFDYDVEHEHDGREPQCEDEGAQCEDEGAADDREADHADEG